MSYDINVLVLNQKKPINVVYPLSFEIINEVDNYEGKRYCHIWPFMTQMNGIWYSFIKEDDGIRNAYLLCTSDVNSNKKDLLLPPWINDAEYIENITPFILKDEYRKDFEITLKLLLEESPNKTILFLSRYQGGDKEIVYGTFSLKDFLVLLDNKNILFNICYIIKE